MKSSTNSLCTRQRVSAVVETAAILRDEIRALKQKLEIEA